jgi:hypothetical protein
VLASKEQSAAIYVGIGKVLVLMNRGAAYELQLAELDEKLLAASDNFERSLIKLYTGVLDFLGIGPFGARQKRTRANISRAMDPKRHHKLRRTLHGN